jgi:hypothetical protein
MNISNGHRFNSSAPDRRTEKSAPPLAPRRRRTWLPFVGVGSGPPFLAHPGCSWHVLALVDLLDPSFPGAVQPHQVRRHQSGRCRIGHLVQRPCVLQPDPGRLARSPAGGPP